MVRLSKKTRDRAISPRRPKVNMKKTGPKKDALKKGFKEHANALAGTQTVQNAYIPKL